MLLKKKYFCATILINLNPFIMKKVLFLLISLFFLPGSSFATRITVTNGADPGTGTLREAIANANNGDTIVFANNVTTVFFSGMMYIDKKITISGNEITNTIFQNALVWLNTGGSSYKRYFQIMPNAEVTFNHLTMKDNVGNCTGGAINNAGTLTLNHCIFSGNKAYDSAGAVTSSGYLTVYNCVFKNNNAPNGSGGAIVCRVIAATINNSLFEGNISNIGNGGAVYIHNDGVVVSISNCTFTGNTAQTGGAIINNSTVTLCNNIIWNNNNNGAKDITTNNNCTAINNLIGNSNINLSGNGNIIGVNPLFVGSGNYSLQETSPAIDNGNNAYLPTGITTDLAGNPRISNGIVDMGAYEFQNNSFIPITNITGIPTTATATLPLALTGTAVPNNATNQAITWTVQSAGTTGATISTGSNILNTTSNGTCIILATIVNGTSPTQNYMQQCTITVNKATLIGTPTITGNAIFGQTLTAITTSLSSTPIIPNLGAFSYQWRRGTTNISGATNSTYVLVQADIGQQINVQVTAANCTGTATSANTTIITKAHNTTVPPAPTLASKTAQSITLTTVSGYEYNIGGGSNFQSSPTFNGLTPNTSYTFTQRIAETATHLASSASPPAYFSTDKAALSGTVTISGSAVFGETLTAVTTALTSVPVVALGTLSYQWQRSGSSISNATNSTYTLVQEDIGSTIAVIVSAANCIGTVTSSNTAVVTKAPQTAPDAPIMEDATTTSITLVTVSGCEYNIDGGAYQFSNIFSGLMPSTSYTFTQRLTESATHFASPASPPANFSTDTIPLYTIVSSVNNPAFGTITPYGENNVEEGDSIVFTITAFPDYKVESVMIDDVHFGAIESYSFQNVHENGTIAVIFVSDVGIDETALSQILVYPNPTTGELRIESKESEIKNVEIFDVFGKKILLNYIVNHIDISDLQAGIYFIKVITTQGEIVKKVVKL
jgi:hypothetical protein